jgi:hypothetical protein
MTVPSRSPSLALVPVSLLLLVAGVGCTRQEPLTGEEAQQAVDEMQVDSQAQALTSNSVEITTNFTIGDAVEKAADELKSFIDTELPCAAVSVSGHTLTVQYGVTGSCVWNGMPITGTHTVSISRNDSSEVEVDHTWSGLTNGKVEVDGTATVTWDLADPSRHIVHDLKWTRLSDGRTGEGKGDRTQRPLPDSMGGLQAGFSEDGERSWDGKLGHWDLDISGLQMRWVDPAPEAGTLTLDTPFDKSVALSFSRVDAATIHVVAQGPNRSFGFDIHSGS